MKEQKLTAELTPEEVSGFEAKAEEIAQTLVSKGISKVHAVVFIQPETLERIAAYVSEPNFDTKIRVMDKTATVGIYTAAKELMDATLIKEHSHPFTFGEGPECDDTKMGIVDFCLSRVKRLQNQIKKK